MRLCVNRKKPSKCYSVSTVISAIFFSLRAHLQSIISTSLANHTVDHDSCGFSLQDAGGYIGLI